MLPGANIILWWGGAPAYSTPWRTQVMAGPAMNLARQHSTHATAMSQEGQVGGQDSGSNVHPQVFGQRAHCDFRSDAAGEVHPSTGVTRNHAASDEDDGAQNNADQRRCHDLSVRNGTQRQSIGLVRRTVYTRTSPNVPVRTQRLVVRRKHIRTPQRAGPW